MRLLSKRFKTLSKKKKGDILFYTVTFSYFIRQNRLIDLNRVGKYIFISIPR